MNRPASAMSLAVACIALALAGCTSDDDSNYIAVGGGGFIFNYRIAEATAGVIAEPQRDLPAGATIEARFEDPRGMEPIVVVKPAAPGRKRYSFTTPPLFGIESGKDYLVTVRVIGDDGEELQRIDYAIRSELDQAVLPEAPLTIGPGYALNRALPPSNDREKDDE